MENVLLLNLKQHLKQLVASSNSPSSSSTAIVPYTSTGTGTGTITDGRAGEGGMMKSG